MSLEVNDARLFFDVADPRIRRDRPDPSLAQDCAFVDGLPARAKNA